MSAVLAAFSLYYCVVCAIAGSLASLVTSHRRRGSAAVTGAIVGAVVYIVQLVLQLYVI